MWAGNTPSHSLTKRLLRQAPSYWPTVTLTLAEGSSLPKAFQDGVRVTMEAVTIDALFEELSFEQEYDLSGCPTKSPMSSTNTIPS